MRERHGNAKARRVRDRSVATGLKQPGFQLEDAPARRFHPDDIRAQISQATLVGQVQDPVSEQKSALVGAVRPGHAARS